jgi:hypothetical protein
MAAIFAFKCSRCDEIHEGSPSFGFRAPDHYAGLSEEQKASMGKLSDDFCMITHDEETDYFIRVLLEVPIHGVEDPFMWGVWVSLSKQNFDRYWDTFENPVAGEVYFGWVCNDIPVYPYAGDRGANVVVQAGDQRPKVFLHAKEHGPQDDPLVIDQRQGISVARAQQLAEQVMHRR